MEKIANDNNEFDEDEYIKELQLRISMLQSERKQTEKEAEIIDNRINVLKIEENKALKGIEVKSKKNQDKIKKFQNLAENLSQKELIKQRKEKEIEEKRKKNIRMKQEIKKNIINKKSERQQHVKEEATLFKLHRKYNDNLLNYLNQEVYATNKERCEIIKTQYMKDKEKKKEEELQRKIQLRDQLKQRLMTESLLRDKAQLEKEQYEQQEGELMKNLQATTKLYKYSNILI